jgi:hypothetical protein
MITATPVSIVSFPVRLTTARLVAFPQFTVEYKTAHLQFIDAMTTAPDFLNPPTVNTALPFPPRNPAVLDGHVLIQLFPATPTATITGDLEIATLRFRVVGPVGESSELPFDLGFSDGRFHTFLGLDDGSFLTDPDIATVSGRITIVQPQPGTFDCIATFTTDAEGEGEIEFGGDNGLPLPCGKVHVCELAGLPIEIHEHATGRVVLVGTVPALPGPCP